MPCDTRAQGSRCACLGTRHWAALSLSSHPATGEDRIGRHPRPDSCPQRSRVYIYEPGSLPYRITFYVIAKPLWLQERTAAMRAVETRVGACRATTSSLRSSSALPREATQSGRGRVCRPPIHTYITTVNFCQKTRLSDHECQIVS
ncbi:hypothetical protein FA95DRAFT_1415619 [Auriscalpium vulgare]|uniref:Uncharacterized protein n=1 Tax=Auriscalpium vulgare TaxID=40419 RepID=A0ACB8RR67_9AGAM|nr:hypothetical protein FA95DRAFT_1415619 [Auriscalpium vulgare]